MTGIYKITSPSGKTYVGQSMDILKTWKYRYKSINSCKSQPRIYNSLKKYGWEAHVFEVIEECSIELLDKRETYYKQIELDKVDGNWSNVLFCGLYDKGGGPKSEQWRRSISIANSKPRPKRFMSQETKDKISMSNKGKKHKFHPKNKEHKSFGISKPIGFGELISKINTGKKTKPRIPIIQLDKNLNIINEYDSYSNAENITGIKGIANVLRGRAKTAGGFKWEYKNKEKN